MTITASCALAFAACSLTACFADDRPIAWERPHEVLGPVSLKNQTVYADNARDRVVTLGPRDRDARAQQRADRPRLLDVALGSVTPLEGIGRLDTYAFSPDGAYLIGATAGVPRVGFLDLANLHPSDLRPDDSPARILTMANGSIFVDHGDPFGQATILPTATATRSQTRVLIGFLLADIFDESY